MINVICMKWGTKFSPEYVNILASRVRRNLSREHRFVCFTDDATGLRPEIETLPLPEMSGLENRPERGWRKLTLFQERLADLSGEALFLDLDVVIAGALDHFFDEAPGDFRIIEDWNLKGTGIGNSSVFRFTIGARPDVLDYFLSHRESVYQAHRNEQAYLSWAIRQKGDLLFWPEGWCVSFKRHLMRPFPLGYFLEPKSFGNAKIIVFHGNPNPDGVRDGWIGKFGLRAVKKCPTIADLWTE